MFKDVRFIARKTLKKRNRIFATQVILASLIPIIVVGCLGDRYESGIPSANLNRSIADSGGTIGNDQKGHSQETFFTGDDVNRHRQSTLPRRQQTTLPNRASSTLPLRGRTEIGRPSTLPRRGSSTLPSRPNSSMSTLPNRGRDTRPVQPLHRSNGQPSTLPIR